MYVTKYSEDEVVSFLKNLKCGDMLFCEEGSRNHISGKTYQVKEDRCGDLFVTGSDGFRTYLKLGGKYNRAMRQALMSGVFSIPKKEKEEEEIISIVTTTKDGENNIVTVRCNDVGLQALREKSNKTAKIEELGKLQKEKSSLQKKIEKIERELSL